MSEWRRAALPVLLAAGILGAGAWWLTDRGAGTPTQEPDTSPEERRAAYYVRDFRLSSAGEGGAWRYQVRAPSLFHFEEQGSWEMSSPRWTLYTETGVPWYGRSESATAWERGERILLHGDVRLWREAAADREPVTIETSDVLLLPEQEEARTEQPAVVRTPGMRLAGTGAIARLEPERVEFLSEVKGRYLPENAQ